MKGRKPKPPEIKNLTGSNKSGFARDLNPPDIEPSRPDPPAGLTPDELAEWEYIVPRLDRMRILEKTNKAGLIILVQAWGDYKRAREVISKEGESYTLPNGKILRHPATITMENAFKRWSSMAGEFGLTPSARARLHVPIKTTASEKKKFLNNFK